MVRYVKDRTGRFCERPHYKPPDSPQFQGTVVYGVFEE